MDSWGSMWFGVALMGAALVLSGIALVRSVR